MRSLQDEIREAQQNLSCPICGRSFQLGEIQVRSISDDAVVELTAVCNRSHFPVILLVPITLKEVAKAGPITKSEMKTAFQRIQSLKTLKDFTG